MVYAGLEPHLKALVFARDQYRCRWCGATNRGLDAHHVAYRRGYAYDRLDNLISLCRAHHDFVHGRPNGAGQTITKAVAQEILGWVIEHPGTVGSSRWRHLLRAWSLEGRCQAHGVKTDECLYC